MICLAIAVWLLVAFLAIWVWRSTKRPKARIWKPDERRRAPSTSRLDSRQTRVDMAALDPRHVKRVMDRIRKREEGEQS